MVSKQENITENPYISRESSTEQKPSLADIKERRKEAMSDGISKAAEKMRGLGGKLLGVLKRINGGAEYILVAPEAIVGAAKFADEKIGNTMDNAAYWTSDVADKAGEFVSEKYADMKEGVAEKITGFKNRGREAVQKFKDNRGKAEQRKQELDKAFRRAERNIKKDENEVKVIRERDKAAKEAGEREEKNKKRWQELQAMYGLSGEIQKLGAGPQEIMDKAA